MPPTPNSQLPDPNPEPPGIRCPRCHSRWVPVQRTVRQVLRRVLRYRKCMHCGKTFCTAEKLVGDAED